MIDILEKYAENLKTIFDVEQEMGQYQYLIDLGKNTPDFSNENRSENENKIKTIIKMGTEYKMAPVDTDPSQLVVKIFMN